MKGPSPARVSKSSAALSAANSVEKCLFSSRRSLRLLSPRGLLPREDGLGVLLVGPTGLLERLLRLPVSLEGMGGLAGTLPGAPGPPAGLLTPTGLMGRWDLTGRGLFLMFLWGLGTAGRALKLVVISVETS